MLAGLKIAALDMVEVLQMANIPAIRAEIVNGLDNGIGGCYNIEIVRVCFLAPLIIKTQADR